MIQRFSQLLADRSPNVRRGVPIGAAALVAAIVWAISARVWQGSAPLAVVLQGAIFGTSTGLLAIGLVLIYRTNKIINFAYGAMGGVGGVLSVMMFVEGEVNYFLSVGTGIAAALLIGGLVEVFAIRRFANATRLILTVATIGLAQALGDAAVRDHGRAAVRSRRDGRLCRARRGHLRRRQIRRRRSSGASRRSTPAQMPTRTRRRGRVHRDRHRRADAGRRRRRGDGRRDRTRRRIRRRPDLHAGLSAAACRPPRGRHRGGAAGARRGRRAEPEPHRRARGVGALEVEVYAKPRIAILSTGNEIVEPGQPLGPGQIYDINRFTLSAIIAAHGGVPVVLPAAQDTIEALSAAIDSALAEDVLVFSGGSSVGERDLILDVLAEAG